MIKSSCKCFREQLYRMIFTSADLDISICIIIITHSKKCFWRKVEWFRRGVILSWCQSFFRESQSNVKVSILWKRITGISFNKSMLDILHKEVSTRVRWKIISLGDFQFYIRHLVKDKDNICVCLFHNETANSYANSYFSK